MTTPARHPYTLSDERRLDDATLEEHIGDLVRLVLLTGPGERLHHSDFGAGLGAAPFAPLDDAVRSMIAARAQGSLQRTLGDRIDVVSLAVSIEGESTLVADVTYRIRTGEAGRVLHVQVQS